MATPNAFVLNERNIVSKLDTTFNDILFIQDCRGSGGTQIQLSKANVDTFSELVGVLRKELNIDESEVFVVATTGRNEIKDDQSWSCVEDGETLYIFNDLNQDLPIQARERVNFLPHYDTIVKGGMYEYYASEGHNPLPFAFAELIDNALAATADNKGDRNIEIRLMLDEEIAHRNTVIVIDNGRGMTSRQLNNWAIYRLSKFIRRESRGPEDASTLDTPLAAPRSLNSDISYFGVGGKQAVFFIGTSTRMISRSLGSKDVHELLISKEEFEQKEKNRESIYSGFICNRKPGDNSHVEDDDVLKNVISEEVNRDSFTAVFVNGINMDHIKYLRTRSKEWTRQLAHIYHYYLHGPRGNFDQNDLDRKAAAHQIDDYVSRLNIQVTIVNLRSVKSPVVINLKDIDDDLQTRYIRSASSTFEFKATVEGTGIVEGLLRYHPFLYDHETYPRDDTLLADVEPDDDHDLLNGSELKPARGKRPIFECYWNGRLIPYSFVDEFDWCSAPKKNKVVPAECFNRISGVLWTNDKFQVSTNKLTFIDLEVKLRDKDTTYTRIVTKESKKVGRRVVAETLEKRTDIGREFMNWLKECHEQCDKQIKFSEFTGTISRPDLPKNRQTPWGVFQQVDWDFKTYKQGSLVRITRVVPVAYGTIQRFMLYGDFEGEVYAMGGDVEIRLEPRSLLDEVKIFPLVKIDRSMSVNQIKKCIEEEEGRLPYKLLVTFPDGDEVKNGDSLCAGATVGNIQIEISNRRGELISKLPGSQQKKLLLELKLTYHAVEGDQVVAQYICQHGKTWPYWFRKMENLRNIGQYTLHLQTVLNESGGATTVAGKQLPTHAINFNITEAEAVKFTIGFLEGPFRIGVPFQIPLEFQDGFSHLTKPSDNLRPELKASGLEITYRCVEVKGNALILKDILALGLVSASLGKNFNLEVKVAGLEEDCNLLKIRMLPGLPKTINVFPEEEQVVENGGELIYNIEIVDQSGNPTTAPKMSIVCKLLNTNDIPPIMISCTNPTVQLHIPLNLKTMKEEILIKAKLDVMGVKDVQPVERLIRVVPSCQPAKIELSYVNSDGESITVKPNQEIVGTCGEAIKGITFVLKDEIDRSVTIDDNVAAKIKANWTPKLMREKLLRGHLPEIRLSSVAGETKYCQLSLADGLDLGFTVKGLAGEPHHIKCTLSGSNKVRLGEKWAGDIQVDVKDKHGNDIKKFEKGVLKDLEITGEGLIASESVRLLGKVRGFNITGFQFRSGPLGVREVVVNFRQMKDSVRIEVVAGPPAKLIIPGWDVTRLISVFNGCLLPRELVVQLCDEEDNPSPEPNIRVQLMKESGLKLTPSPAAAKTDKFGRVNFGVFNVSAKAGTYELQAKAFLSRNIIAGPQMLLSVQPDATKPVSVIMQYVLNESYSVGDLLPEFKISILAENEAPVTGAKPSYMRMKMFLVENAPGMTNSSSSTLFFQPDDDKTSSTSGVTFFRFSHREIPTAAGTYNIVFIYDDGNHYLASDAVVLSALAGPPTRCVPTQDPGTPTVSNATNAASRTVIRSLQFELRDEFDNSCGFKLNGKLHVEVINSTRDAEIPILVGNTTHLQLNLIEGRAIVQNLMIQENSPGKDGQEYFLRFKVDIPTDPDIQIPCYDLPFLFYNDLKKQTQMAMLSRERDTLALTVQTYKSLFETTEQLIAELRSSVNDAKREELTLKSGCIALKLSDSELSAYNLESTIQGKLVLKQQISQRPRRICGLQPTAPDPDVFGKIGHLAEVVDTDIAVVLSWHMSADMDCVVTTTTQKAQELHKQSYGRQQVLPLDSIYRKALPDWTKPLPHFRSRPHWKPPGNPEYARNALRFPKDEESCKIVFGMLLGDTLLLDTLDDASSYRQELVKFTHCPTILTRTGDRVRSNGKFGGLMNRALPLDKLKGAVFGEPLGLEYHTVISQIELLQNYRAAILKRQEAEDDLNVQVKGQMTPEIKAKRREWKETEDELQKVEARLGVTSRASWGSSAVVPLLGDADKRIPEQCDDQQPTVYRTPLASHRSAFVETKC